MQIGGGGRILAQVSDKCLGAHVGIGRIYHANGIHVHVYVVTYMYKPDSRADVPEPQCSIPRSQESKLSIAADHNIRDKVFVPMETMLGYTIFGLITNHIPYNDHLIWRRKKFKCDVMWLHVNSALN